MLKQTWLRIGLAAGILVSAALGLTYATFLVSAQGTRIQYGDTVEGEITTADQTDTWLFDGVAGDVITVRVERTSDDLVPAVALSGPDHTLLVDLDWPEAGSVVFFTAGLRVSGEQTLTVSGHAGTTGAYSLALELQEAGSVGEALTYGRMVSGAITDETFREFWTFQGTRNDVVDVLMTATFGDLDTYLTLTAPSGAVLAASDSGGTGQDAALYAVTLPSTGTYTLEARRAGGNFGSDGSTQGTYDLSVVLRSPGAEDSEAVPATLNLGTDMRGRLTADAPVALYSIEAQGVLSAALTLFDLAHVGTIRVMTLERALLGSFSGITHVRSDVVLPGRGIFLVEVSTVGVREDTPVDFVLSVDQLATATRGSRALLYGQSQITTVTSATEPQAWHFAGRAGDSVTLSLTPFNPLLEGIFQVVGPDGVPLLQRAINSGFVQPLALRETGIYELFVEPGAGSSGYQISVEQEGTSGLSFDQHTIPQLRGVLLPGERNAVSMTLEPAGSDAWEVDVPEAKAWYFALDRVDGNTPIVLVLEAPDGTRLGVAVTDRVEGTAVLQIDLPHAGRYRVVVFDPTGSRVEYALQGQPVEGENLRRGEASKGMLSAEHPADQWTLDVPADSLLNVQVELLTDSVMPAVYVVGPDGLLVGSSEYVGPHVTTGLVGIPAVGGGPYWIVVAQPFEDQRTVYRITAEIDAPFGIEAIVAPVEEQMVSEVFAVGAAPTPVPARITIASQVTPPLRPDSAVLASARRAEPETLVRGEVEPGGLYQAWVLSPDRAQRALGISAIALDGSTGPDILVLNQDGDVLAESFRPSTTANYLMHRFPTSNDYYVVVRSDHGGRYVLWIDVLADIDETVPGVLAGQTVAYGETMQGEILPQGDDGRRFVFFGHAGDVVLARLVRTQGHSTLHLALRTLDGSVIEEANTGDTTPLADLPEIRLPNDDIYQLVVTAEDAQETDVGRFALHLNLKAATVSTERGGGLLEDQHIAGLRTGDLLHHWLFDAESGERVTVRVEPLTAGTPNPLILQLADTAGNVFLEKEAQIGQGALVFYDVLLPRTGVYQALVSGGQRQAGLYRISLERDPAPLHDDNGAIRYGETVGRVLTQENYLDVWTFAGSQGDELAIATRVVRGDPALLSFQLRDSSGQVLSTAVDEGTIGARVQNIVLPSDGYYSVAVGNLDGAFEGETAYALTVHLENTPARSMGTVLAYGQPVEGSLFIDDPVDTWLFAGQQGDVISVVASGQSPSLAPTLDLLSADWHAVSVEGASVILASAQADGSGPARIEGVVLSTSGSYALVVRDPSGAGGTYQLVVEAETGSALASKPVVAGETSSGEISSQVLREAWTFTGVQGVTVTITVLPESRSALLPSVALLAPDGTALAHAAGENREARIEGFRLPQDGTYTVVVSRVLGSEGRTAGRYTLDVQQTPPSGGDRTPTEYDQLQRGALGMQLSAVRWEFTGQAGDVVCISAETTSGNLDPVLRLYDPRGVLVAGGDDEQGLNAEITYALLVDGVYQVEVARYGRALGTTEGNYALLVERVYRFETVAQDQLMVYGDRVTGTTDSENRSDYWGFVGQRGDVIYAKIQFPVDESPLTLRLRDPAGSEMAVSVRDRGDSVISAYTLPVSGLYVLEVHRPGDATSSYSPYALDLLLLSAPVGSLMQGGALVLDRPVTGHFAEAPAVHTWVFEGKADQVVSLSLTQLSGPLALGLTLIAPDGSVVFAADAQPGTTRTFSTEAISLPWDGVYILQIAGEDLALSSMYRLLLQSAVLGADNPTEISLVQDGIGTVSSTQPYQRWRFEAAAGETLSVYASATSGDLQPAFMLWGPDGRPLAEGGYQQLSNGSRTSVASFVVPQSGFYHLTVGRLGGVTDETAGSYRLMVRQHGVSDHATVARDVAFGERVVDFVRGENPQLYAFRGTAGDVVAISVRVTDGGGIPELSLEAENGVPIRAPVNMVSNEVNIPAFVLPYDGRYIVVLRGGQTVPYVFNVWRRVSEIPADAPMRELLLNQSRVFSIDQPTESTYWNFTSMAGRVYTFAVDTTGGGLRADMALYGPSGYVASASEQPGSRETTLGPVRLPDDGAYVLVVRPWLGEVGGSVGRYAVRWDTVDPAVSGSVGGHLAAYGTEVTGGLVPQDPQDIWTFDGHAGETVAVRVVQTVGDETLQLSLIGPDSGVLAAGQAAVGYRGVEVSSLVLPVTGVYEVTLSGAIGEGDRIEYRLIAEHIPGPVTVDLATASQTNYGQVQAGALPAGAGYQVWTFSGQAGDQIACAVKAVDGSFAPSVYLVGPAGSTLFADIHQVLGEDTRLAGVVLPDNGTYALVVAGDGTAGEGQYALALEQLAAGPEVQGVLDTVAQGELTPAVLAHAWKLMPISSGRYRVQLESFVPDSALGLFVLSADGKIVGTGSPSGMGQMTVTLRLEAGFSYTVVVSGGSLRMQGQYAIRLDPASVEAGGTILEIGVPDVGRIGDEHFTDEWRVQGPTEGEQIVQVARAGGDLALVVTLLDQNGAQIRQETTGDDGIVNLPVTLSEAGEYRVLVSRVGRGTGQTTGNYTITLGGTQG